ncbi:MAG TPA: hypothetical protein VJN43_03235 [Bryobacteraceae bacterium]|nr:hypothetical protein [Bryobacteraceae bacterium]
MRFLLLLASALSAGCGSAIPGRTRVDSTLAALTPPDATMLAGVRMEALRATPVYRKMAAAKRLSRLDDFARETGFDPRRDVRELLVASNGKDSIVAARGTFHINPPAGTEKTSYKGCTLYTRDRGAVALLDNSTAIAGNVEAVRAAIDRYKSGNRSGPEALLARARDIAPENQIWSVSSGFDSVITGRIPETGNAANIGRILRSLENTTAAADFTSGIHGYLTGVCTTDQDAKNLGDTARGLVGLGRLSVPEGKAELLKIWDGIQVEQQQRTVKITVAIPQDLVDQLIEMLGTLPGAARRLPVSSLR